MNYNLSLAVDIYILFVAMCYERKFFSFVVFFSNCYFYDEKREREMKRLKRFLPLNDKNNKKRRHSDETSKHNTTKHRKKRE